MLNFKPNVYDILEDVRKAMGTDPDPVWMLVYNSVEQKYSALDYKKPQELVEFALQNNVVAVCLIDPSQLVEVLDFDRPDVFCKILFEWVSFHRPKPDQISLADFLPSPDYYDPSIPPEGSKGDGGSHPANGAGDVPPVEGEGEHSGTLKKREG